MYHYTKVLLDELKHLRNIGGTPEWAGMIIASDYLRKMGTTERGEACPLIKSEWPEAFGAIAKQFPERIV